MATEDKQQQYCLQHSTSPNPLLYELERDTHLQTLQPQMLSGSFQGMFLKMISQMIRPRRILEIGTFTGYSAICLAQGLTTDGQLHTVEANDELAPIINRYIRLAGLEHQIVLHLGDASAVVPALDEVFDLVFLDAGKMDYSAHYHLALPKLRPGGFLLADNVLWDGKVAQNDKDASAQALRDFNAMVQADDRVENVLLPLRDGLMLVRRKEHESDTQNL
ncbi:MAG: O-methyltransferase [Lewinellaceae bacterium]|nr:O-methyltransferase [Lewinellaceae bacterium]